MTGGTSPRPGASPSNAWAAAIAAMRGASAPLAEGGRWWLARGAASLHLAALGVLLTTAWREVAPGEAALAPLANWHLAFLIVTGAAAALLTLSGARRAEKGFVAGVADGGVGVAELMAQMSHELRTPLNAVIGFSEVMRRELHGPLGHARYQEYARHISESGGRLLQSSEQALAITEALTALMADGLGARRERVSAEAIVRDAWRRIAATPPQAARCLTTPTLLGCELVCERRPTTQAIEYLLGEALAGSAGGVDVVDERRGTLRCLTIKSALPKNAAPKNAVPKNAVPMSAPPRCAARQDLDSGDGLRVGLARLLLQAQGAALLCSTRADGTWSAVVSFPGR
jgi:signal transduction histidine kinase